MSNGERVNAVASGRALTHWRGAVRKFSEGFEFESGRKCWGSLDTSFEADCIIFRRLYSLFFNLIAVIGRECSGE